MTLRLTPAALIAAYEYLRTTAPFNKWKLPDADDLEFKVTDCVDMHGHFQADNDGPDAIAVSTITTKTTFKLMETMAHEMTHLKQRMDQGFRQNGYGHGQSFQALARRVCRAHGFDLRTF